MKDERDDVVPAWLVMLALFLVIGVGTPTGAAMRTSGALSGYKTYVAAGATILMAWGAFLIGEPLHGQEVLSLAETFQLTVTAVLGATIRHGIKTGA